MTRRIFQVALVWTMVIIFTEQLFSQSVTEFKGAGKYGEFLDDLHTMMIEHPLYRKTTLGGKERQEFVFWLRDHVHVLKALKYWEKDVSSFVEFFLERQTPRGMFYDYYYPIERDLNWRMNVFDKKYWKIYSAEGIQMHRLPVTADVEYLAIEGVYYIWQSTGDTAFVKKWLGALEKGIMYCMTDPIRWSTKHQLIKRAYTLDTWDFQQLPVPLEELGAHGYDSQDVMFNVTEDTPQGIMHGDNSGLYAACRQLAVMHSSLGHGTDADVWNHYAEIIRLRTNQVCWNGKFYKHFAIEDAPPVYNTMDQETTLGLSNTYDINRGLPTEDMAQSIIQSYKDLREQTKDESFAEWFGVYPPVEPYFGTEKPGQYLNGGVITIVAGELAKAALQHGYEEYGIDILDRLYALSEKFDKKLPCVFQRDASKGHGIPDNWGQAAVASALIEGLAGVVDDASCFNKVTISPRWSYTEIDDVEVNVAYGPSGKNVNYTFRRNPQEIVIDLSGEASLINLRALVPRNVRNVTAQINENEVTAKMERIRNSYYAVVNDIKGGTRQVKLSW